MIRLNLSREPEWLDLGHGIEVLVPPLTTGLIAMARESDLRAEMPEDAGLDRKVVALTTAIARLTIIDWRGVAMGEDDAPAPVTPATIDAVMDIYPVSQAFYARYVAPGLVLVAEKKGSAPLPNGNSERAQDTASTAPGDATTAPDPSTPLKH